jgi:ElaB/YqjD/DUF883 family membrane-anchored ribosome-binding protein
MKRMGIDIKAEKDELASTINDAVAAIRAALAEFSDNAAARKTDAAGAMRKAGQRAADQAGHLAADARASADRSVDSLSEQVAANPIAALAIAAGVGFILAQLTRLGR